MTKNHFEYDLTGGKSVTSEIVYVTEADAPNTDGRVSTYSYKVNGTKKAETQNRYNDNYKRLTAKLVIMGSYTYDKGFTYDKTRVSRVMDVKNGSIFHNVSYGYDSMGRIVSESDSVNTNLNNTYTYDSFGQLIRENNKLLDKTYLYSYNEIGNITSVSQYAYTTDATPSGTPTTTAYTYDTTHPDRLVCFGDKVVVYNSIGCPSSYNGMTYGWSRGKLSSIGCGAANQGGALYKKCAFTYDGYGRRTHKIYNYDPNPASTSDYSYTYVTTYDYDSSGRLIREYCTERYIGGNTTTRELIFLYDESGIVGVSYSKNGVASTSYYFHKNLQGDVIAIYNSNGTKIGEYAYDAFGNCTILSGITNDLVKNNPIRYRGYYYDRETGLYYLNARYYDPEWRRFISPDDTAYLDPESVNGLNLYCYCGNDPVNYCDPSGKSILPNWAKWVIGSVAFVGAVVLTTLTGGSLLPVFLGMASSIIVGGLAGGIASYLQGEDFWSGFANGMANGAMWGGLSLFGGAAIRTFNIFKNGVVIGENMTRVKVAAKQLGGVQIYAGKPGFKILKAIKGEAYATTKALAHNKAWLTRMMNWGVKVYDIGIDLERTTGRSIFYEMETTLVNSYFNMVPCYLI